MGWLMSLQNSIAKFRDFSNWQKLHITLGRLDTLEGLALRSEESGVAEKVVEKPLTVSLTTYGHRIYDVHTVIESIFQQSMRANRVILWLSEDEFSADSVPLILRRQEARGLEIRFCEDIKSYKKIVPALREGTEGAIITIDDDVIYPVDTVERLFKAHLRQPNRVHCNRGHVIKLDVSGSILPYAQWEYDTRQPDASALIVPTGCCGVIYGPELLDTEVTDASKFMSLCPTADDLWLKAMTLKQGVECQLVPYARPYESFLKIPDNGAKGLFEINQIQNDVQFARLLEKYPELAAAIV
ncbi:hypothetical protein F0M18_16645 [Pseudohalioglobus sediminis]|uniref:Glycosyl transferase family 2 n=1 Tax=Pseudohalioglobus sediminis TaxID=2606449 RepID=A0A5B0WP31_9GAMM|nr:glycosyltransferase family A protein [Pseudohalioglobus sediminis]KAA1188834.1 hypothetical protein F0M18_16645 [Pseudohalioglobus sediminis]